MNHIPRKIIRFLLAEDGPTAIEYAMLLLLVLLACLTAITVFGQATATSWGESQASVEKAIQSEPAASNRP